jgi:hypothetical protein
MNPSMIFFPALLSGETIRTLLRAPTSAPHRLLGWASERHWLLMDQ